MSKNKFQFKLLRGPLIAVAVLLVIFICFDVRKNMNFLINTNDSTQEEVNDEVNDGKETNEIEIEEVEEDNTIEIVSLGNIILHDKQLEGGQTAQGYDFTKSFEYVKELIVDADISIGILETTFPGGTPQGFPLFRSPDEFLDNIKESGVDIINYANNHIIDGQSDGFFRTMEITEEKGLDYIGIKKQAEDKNYIIKEVDGEKIGFLAYTYETPKINGKKAINGIKVPSDITDLINSFNYNELDYFYENIESEIASMKAEGAKYIIASVHWGEEYETIESTYQNEMAIKLNQLGVDIILGGHPHVIQPYEIIVGEDNHETFVLYSQGNALSNQCEEEIGVAESEDGFIADLILEVNDGVISLKEYNVIPTWVYREEKEDGTFNHRIIPVEDAIENKDKYNLTDEAYSRVKESLERTKSIIN